MKRFSTLTRFTAIAATLLASPAINAQELTEEASDTTRTHELKEVVVKGERILHKPGYDILTLSEENKKFGVNALEAISSMNYFITGIGNTELTSYDQKPVLITINGVPATGMDLCTYRADQILRVEYFAVTPVEFRDRTDGPVINVITRRPRTQMVSGYFNLSNAVTTLLSANSANLVYADSLNRLQASYNQYNHNNNLENTSRYRYAPDHVASYDETGKHIYNGHTLSVEYQRHQGSHMFSASINGMYDHSKDRLDGLADITDGPVSADGTLFDLKDAFVKSVSLDLYYRLDFSGGKTLAITAVNSFTKSASHANMLRDVAPPYDALNYDIASSTDNDTYGFAAGAMYLMPVRNGQLSAMVHYDFTRLWQTNMGNRYSPHTHQVQSHAQYVWMKNGFQIIPSIGLAAVSTVTSNGTTSIVSPMFGFNSSWDAPKGFIHGWSAILNYRLLTYTTLLGNMTDSYSYLDNGFVSAGNPDLHYYRQHNVNLSVRYMSPDGRNSFFITMMPRYARHPMAKVLSADGDMMVLRMENIKSMYANGFSSSFAWKVLPWLELRPYVDYNYQRFTFDSETITHNQWRLGGGITVSKDHFELSGAFNPPIKSINGDILSRKSTQTVGTVRYKTGNFSVSGEYRHSSQNEYTMGHKGNFSYKQSRSRKSLANYFSITLTYSFQKGKRIYHEGKILQESAGDSGLGSHNSVTK